MQREPWFCQDCRLVMLYNKKEDFHICPKCKVRVYHADDKDDYLNDEVRSLMRDMYKTHLPQKEPLPINPYPAGYGGSKSKGRNRKQEMKKKTLSQINAGLTGKASDYESR
ncbi:MAG TPA: hypothetical protein PKA10_07735 [Selenomonadales bacterium]|nr:hypothetical protein [Selenomonadales bacterium]